MSVARPHRPDHRGLGPRPVVTTHQATRVDEGDGNLRRLQAVSLAILKVPRCEADQPATLVDAAEDALVELGTHLSQLFGAEGCRALLSRALHIASNDFPSLADVRPAAAQPGRLIGLHKLGRAQPAEALEAIAATLAGVMLLLLNFIGEDLTQRLLGEVWPWVSDTRLRERECDRAIRLTA